MRRLVVVAEDSLIVEAIAIGLRKSGDFRLLDHIDARSASVEKIVEASPDVVLIDYIEHPDRALELIRQIKAERESIAVVMLTLAPDPALLDAVFDAGATGAVSKASHPLALATLIRETVEGRVLNLYKPVDAIEESKREPVAKDSLLSPRELEVLRLVVSGSTNGEIAQKLWVTEQTVKFHLSNIYRKLGVGNRTEASHYAHLNRLLSDNPRSGDSAVAS